MGNPLENVWWFPCLLFLRWQSGHSFQLGEKTRPSVKLATIHNAADNEACLRLGEPNAEDYLSTMGAAAANGETSLDPVDALSKFSNLEMGNGLGSALQSCAKGLAKERTW